MDMERVILDLESEHITHGIAYLLDPGIAEFLHLAAGFADQVIVLAKGVGLFELGFFTGEPMLADKVAIHQ